MFFRRRKRRIREVTNELVDPAHVYNVTSSEGAASNSDLEFLATAKSKKDRITERYSGANYEESILPSTSRLEEVSNYPIDFSSKNSPSKNPFKNKTIIEKYQITNDRISVKPCSTNMNRKEAINYSSANNFWDVKIQPKETKKASQIMSTTKCVSLEHEKLSDSIKIRNMNPFSIESLINPSRDNYSKTVRNTIL